MRCRLKCHNERNPSPRLPSGDAGHSGDTAIARCEEGGDDVKSARPLRPGLHTCYNGAYRGKPPGDGARIPKVPPSSDRSLQPDSAKLDSLVIAHQPWRGEYVPGPCTHRPSSHESRGTPPFWSVAPFFVGVRRVSKKEKKKKSESAGVPGARRRPCIRAVRAPLSSWSAFRGPSAAVPCETYTRESARVSRGGLSAPPHGVL